MSEDRYEDTSYDADEDEHEFWSAEAMRQRAAEELAAEFGTDVGEWLV